MIYYLRLGASCAFAANYFNESALRGRIALPGGDLEKDAPATMKKWFFFLP
jgi:hypothetical protein